MMHDAEASWARPAVTTRDDAGRLTLRNDNDLGGCMRRCGRHAWAEEHHQEGQRHGVLNSIHIVSPEVNGAAALKRPARVANTSQTTLIAWYSMTDC